MHTFLKNVQFVATSIATSILLTACGSDSLAVKVVDNIDTEHQAKISYINVTQSALTFFTKSTVYANSVYNSQHRVTELIASEFSPEFTHKWIDGAHETTFAIQDSNTGQDEAQLTVNLSPNKGYWALAWQQGQSESLSVLEKSTNNQPGQYAVRVFANANLDVRLNQSSPVTVTQQGEVTSWITVEVCSDLQVGEYAIDLCQSANMGQSYLVVLNNQTGDYVVAQE